MNNPPVLVVVCGPTASGKTKLSVDLAKYFQTEVLSADSRQFYRELNIGTAKPGKEEQNGIPHHFINSLSIKDKYSVGDFERDAIAVLHQSFIQHKVIIMAGGSGLFINAVCKGLDKFPEITKEVRERVKTLFDLEGIAGLISALEKVDPEYLKQVDQNNPHRLMRALEVFFTSGQPFSFFRKGDAEPRFFNTVKIALDWEREELYDRINLRVEKMLDNGLEEEARQLLPYRDLNALQTVGYQEWFPYFDGLYDKEEAVRLIKRNSRRYAKRQLTWFRKDSSIMYFKPEAPFSSITNFLEDQINVRPTR